MTDTPRSNVLYNGYIGTRSYLADTYNIYILHCRYTGTRASCYIVLNTSRRPLSTIKAAPVLWPRRKRNRLDGFVLFSVSVHFVFPAGSHCNYIHGESRALHRRSHEQRMVIIYTHQRSTYTCTRYTYYVKKCKTPKSSYLRFVMLI